MKYKIKPKIMKSTIVANWNGNMSFKSVINGHELIVDAVDAVGGEDRGPRPKPLMMLALAGCTGMDVVSILKKMRVEFKDFNVKVDSEMTEEHPKVYSSMHITYEITGSGIDFAKVEKAVTLSQENYCGVSAMYKKAMKITHEIKIIEE